MHSVTKKNFRLEEAWSEASLKMTSSVVMWPVSPS